MPIYEYVCSKCKHEFELLVRKDDRPRCPACGHDGLDKQFSVPAAARAELPVTQPVPGGCGRPQCGTGCQFE